MNYEYSRVNRFTTPHNYMYTKYEGPKFLGTYIEFRKNCLEKLRGRIGEFDNIINFSDFSLSDFRKTLFSFLLSSEQESQVDFDSVEDLLIEMQSEKTVQTIVFFKRILILMLNSKQENLKDFYKILSIFIKKYEVFKRIFSQYSSQFKKKSEDYASLSPYILITLCSLYYHHHIPNLKFLNVSLKINDALCSVIDEIPHGEDCLFFNVALIMEIDAIEKLADKKGVIL